MVSDTVKYENLCDVGREKWRFAKGMNRNAELHGKRFWAIQQTSNEAGQDLLSYLKNCEECKS